jgi:hypothetical protein
VAVIRRSAAAAAAPAPVDDQPRDDGNGGRLWTWVALAAGVALGATATVLYLDGQQQYDDLHARCAMSSGCTDAEVDASGLDGRATAVNALFAGSAVALVAAAILFFAEGGSGSESSTAVSFSRDGLQLRWRL